MQKKQWLAAIVAFSISVAPTDSQAKPWADSVVEYEAGTGIGDGEFPDEDVYPHLMIPPSNWQATSMGSFTFPNP